MNLTSILAVLKSKIDLDKMAKFNISRNDVLDGARRAIHRKSFQPYYRMSIKFTDDIGVAEGAVDAGGPKRELLRLLIRKIQTLPIFEGPSNSRSLAFRQSGKSLITNDYLLLHLRHIHLLLRVHQKTSLASTRRKYMT